VKLLQDAHNLLQLNQSLLLAQQKVKNGSTTVQICIGDMVQHARIVFTSCLADVRSVDATRITKMAAPTCFTGIVNPLGLHRSLDEHARVPEQLFL
jgi:hypothetical protein